MKPRMFIGSSVEHLDLAYAAQENLEHDVEPTVWSQGVFALSRTAMASLMDQLDESDFGLFILAPDDITQIRDLSQKTVRDNVIFELGLFIGRLGSDRCFMLVPRGVEDLHFPSDLLGLTPATYDPERTDKNLSASLGPACNRIRKAVIRLGLITPIETKGQIDTHSSSIELCSDPNDRISLIQSWMGSRPSSENHRAMRYDEIDRELRLAPGSARLYLEEAAKKWNYRASRKGKDIILFEDIPYDPRRNNYF